MTDLANLVHTPHHDGSALYVDRPAPGLGQPVRVWLRAPRASSVEWAHVRTVEDGHEKFTPMTIDRHRTDARGARLGSGDTWWTAELVQENPDVRYRFLLGSSKCQVWLTASGVVDHDVTDRSDFRLVSHPPSDPWSAEAVVYEIFPDRFAREGDRPLDPADVPDWAVACRWDEDAVAHQGTLTPRQLFGGDLDGIVERLDHLEALGVDTIYLRPAFEAESNHRYNATSFDAIDPVVGGEQALERLAKAVHDRGMRLIGDITTNHCGDTHEWFRTGRQDAASVERSMFYFDERGGYESWLGVPTLPKLNWSSETTHERMAGVVTRWLGVYDGWRVDVANMTGRRGAEEHTRTVASTLRQVTRHERPDSVLIAEHMFDASDDLDADGWDGIMNYAGFTRPVWTWLGGQSSADIDFLGRPGGIPRASGPSAVASMRTLSASISWQSLVRSWLVLDSFDCARIRSVVGSRERQVVAVGLQATLPGVPMICAGSEWGLLADTGEQGRIPMPWNRPDQRDESVFERYRELFGLRSTEQALRIGGMRWLHVGDDVMVFARETAEETLVVCASRGPAGAVCLPLQGTLEALYAAEDLAPVDGMVELSADGPAVRVWRLRHRVAV